MLLGCGSRQVEPAISTIESEPEKKMATAGKSRKGSPSARKSGPAAKKAARGKAAKPGKSTRKGKAAGKASKTASAKKAVKAKTTRKAAKSTGAKKSAKGAKTAAKKKTVRVKKTAVKKKAVKAKAAAKKTVKSRKAAVKKQAVKGKKAALKRAATPAKTSAKRSAKVAKKNRRTTVKKTTREVTPVKKGKKAGLSSVKKALLQRRSQLLDKLSRHTAAVGEVSEKPVGDRADDASFDLELDSTYSIAARESEELRLIDVALEKITEGTYGICEECSENIEGPRLKALPYAVMCLKCKEAEEMEQSADSSY